MSDAHRSDGVEGDAPVAKNPDILLLPVESRPWTGTSERSRFLPERVFASLEWLDPEEAEIVNRKTWDGFVDLLEREGYGMLLKLAERVEARTQRKQEGSNYLRRIERAEEAKLQEARRMLRAFGSDGSVEAAVGHADAEGWERRGVTVAWDLAPGAIGEPSLERWNALLSFPEGTTWGAAVSGQTAKRDDARARFISAQKTYLAVGYRRDVLGEVLRHYETYGVLWGWGYEEIEQADVKIDETVGVPPWTRRFAPHREWIVTTYSQVRPEHATDKAARAEVIARFGDEFASLHTAQHGRYEPPSVSTIRRALNEID